MENSNIIYKRSKTLSYLMLNIWFLTFKMISKSKYRSKHIQTNSYNEFLTNFTLILCRLTIDRSMDRNCWTSLFSKTVLYVRVSRPSLSSCLDIIFPSHTMTAYVKIENMPCSCAKVTTTEQSLTTFHFKLSHRVPYRMHV